MQRNIKKVYLLIGVILILSIPFYVRAFEIQYAIEQEQEEEERYAKEVYLTFDDGPTQGVTEELLDVLKEYDVKATFFIVGKEILECEHILQRIYDEGHAIGLHTYSHNIKKIYCNKETFIDEMKQTEKAINDVLGVEIDSKVIRFPGGSRGRLTTDWLEALQQEGYKIFDWNVCIEDGVKPHLLPSQFVEKAKQCTRNPDKRIILAHCNLNNQNTCKALPDIIKYYQDEGYVFKKLENNTEEFYFPIKK